MKKTALLISLVSVISLAAAGCGAKTDPDISELQPFAENFRDGSYEAALGEIDRLAERYPESFDTLNRRVSVLLRMGDWKEALSTCGKMLALKPDSAETYLAMGMIAILSGDPDGARAHFDESAKIFESRMKGKGGEKRARSAILNRYVALYLGGRKEEADALIRENVPRPSDAENKVVSMLKGNSPLAACRIILGL